ncbi:MAG: VOC family protein [Caldilinea sp. CFX5]|nr:VOC family protein [Caldilinea sp. CFX5]
MSLFAVQRTNTILYCAHWSPTVAFYRDQLGLPITHSTDWFVEFQLGATAYLSIADSARATIPSADGAGLTLSWQVVAIGLIQQRLTERGIATTPIKKKWGAQVLYFHDPEGHRIELWEML